MQQIFIELSKYIFAFLIAFYTLASYQGAVMHSWGGTGSAGRERKLNRKEEKYILRRMY